ncbi:MAG: PAS domain S-box protein [Anaerolineae bacterium]|nr:PAS domain S-box protein [Anaerolineae bacterium]
MGTKHTSTGNTITRLKDAVRNHFQTKILVISLGGMLFSILLSGLIFFLGMRKLTKDVFAEVALDLEIASQQHLESQITSTAERINLWMRHAQADLRIFATITQQLIDHREEFRPMTEAIIEIPFFADKMQYYPEGGYSQNAPDEPTVVTLQTLYHDETARIKPHPQQVINETAILDLFMPAIHTQGAKKMWTYFAGDTEAGFLRLFPWTDFGKEAIENYPEQMHISYWTFFPGLVEAWEKGLETPDSTTGIVTFPPAIDATSGQAIQIFGHPLWNRERTQFAGAVWYDLALAEITNIIEEMQLTQTGFAFLALGDGNVIAIPEHGIQALGLQERILGDGHLLRDLEDSRERAVAALTLPGDDAVSFLELRLAGRDHIMVMRRLAPMNVFLDGAEQIAVQYWTLGFVVPKDETYAPLIAVQTNVTKSFKSILLLQGGLLVVVAAGLAGLMFFLTERMTRGLAELSAGAHQIAQGDFDTQVEILSTDEIGRLARMFNEMAHQLKESFDRLEHWNTQLKEEALERQLAEKDLQESQERLRLVLENMPVMMDAFDAEGNILVWNKACEWVTGYSAEEMINNPRALEWLYPDPDYRQQMLAQWAERGGDYYNWEWTLTARDGAVKTVAWSSISDRFPIPGWATWGTGVDVTKQAQVEKELWKHREDLEEMITQRTDELNVRVAEVELLNRAMTNLLQDFQAANAKLTSMADWLKATNQELESFAYAVSHDLRAPLRGIDGWSLALLEDYGEQLDATARQYLDSVRAEAQRMGQLIDALLHLSRVTRAEMQIQHVNLSALAQAVIARLQAEYPDREVEVHIQPDLMADGDATLFEAMLTNLLGNAWKFTRTRTPACIEFGVMAYESENKKEDQERKAFFVRDNGVGFDMAYAKKLFGAFQRMHKASEFPGTGIGLATVRRIIHRHGGQVWAEAQVDQGATFYFTLKENL